MLLLCKAWRESPPGSIPNDDAVLARWARVTPDCWAGCRTHVLAAFTLGTDSRWHQKRMRAEYQKFAARHRAISQAGQSAARQKWKKEKSDEGHKTRSQRLIAARKLGTHTQAEWCQLVSICGSRCVKCGKENDLVKDHVKPIYQGGSDSIENLQPLCGTCNRSKGPDNKDYRPTDWQKRLRNVCETSADDCLSVPIPIKHKTPLPPAGAGDSSEQFFNWCRETIGVQMGRRRRLPSLGSYEGAQAQYVVDFLNGRGFPSRIVRPA